MWFCVDNRVKMGRMKGWRKIVVELQKGGRKCVVLCG